MKKPSFKKGVFLSVLLITVILLIVARITESNANNPFFATAWSLLPPIVSITLALVTKEVYSSLFIGIISGAVLYTNFSAKNTVIHVLRDGIIGTVTDKGKMSILLFVIILGIFVELINRSGGADAFGNFVGKHIKSRTGIQLMASVLGVFFFIDDGFSCFTTGSIMRPVCDRNKISRAKLAYIIDSTAAPVCIIAPVSSWAAAITGYVEKGKGLKVFINAIPFNFYAILSLIMIVALSVFKLDYGAMRKYETHTDTVSYEKATETEPLKKGKVCDLILPVLALIIGCIVGMLYTGGFFKGASFLDAVSLCDAPLGFVYGSSVALVFTIIYYLLRGLMPFSELMNCLPEGIKLMTAPMIILVFAWTLKLITNELGIGEFVGGIVANSASLFKVFLPAVIFVIAALLSFSTGTSWGTFGLLIPITLEVFPLSDPLGIVSLSACMAGSVFGDHCSPISDTTIMSSAAADCDHVVHVSTQMPYAVTVAAISFIGYILAGFIPNAYIVLPVTAVLLILALIVLRKIKKEPAD